MHVSMLKQVRHHNLNLNVHDPDVSENTSGHSSADDPVANDPNVSEDTSGDSSADDSVANNPNVAENESRHSLVDDPRPVADDPDVAENTSRHSSADDPVANDLENTNRCSSADILVTNVAKGTSSADDPKAEKTHRQTKCCKVFHTLCYCLCLKHPVSFVICDSALMSCVHTLMVLQMLFLFLIFRFACLGPFLLS